MKLIKYNNILDFMYQVKGKSIRFGQTGTIFKVSRLDYVQTNQGQYIFHVELAEPAYDRDNIQIRVPFSVRNERDNDGFNWYIVDKNKIYITKD